MINYYSVRLKRVYQKLYFKFSFYCNACANCESLLQIFARIFFFLITVVMVLRDGGGGDFKDGFDADPYYPSLLSIFPIKVSG